MLKYDFNKRLEPYEFQYFIRDLLQIRENCFFESFSIGPDKGIDLRKTENDNTIVVQIKRYKNDFNKFFNNLKKYELPKVQELKPDRYIIATSVTLTVSQKQEVLDLFSDYIKSPEDILSEIDLNNLLAQEEYQTVELNYPSLWFESSNIFFEKLDCIINNDLYEEARAEYENIQETMKHYVPIPKFPSIINDLKVNRFLLITGNPGIGKTSLARAIVAYFIQKENYQFIYTRNVESANKVYKVDKKQIFFFDDFWGSCFKEKDYNFDEERRLAEFIRKISKSTNKLLILTSRFYVLKQGLISNLELENIFNHHQYLLELKNYNLKLRMDILMRHLYKSSLKFTYVEFVIRNAEKIIKHRNFNPRIIESYINSGFDLEVNPYKYVEYFISDLDEPFEFLDKIYKKQSKEAQLLLYLLLTIQDSILIEDLKELYLNALDCANAKGRHFDNYNIQSMIDQLEKNFIKTRYIEAYGITVEFTNHSIKDYLFEYKDNFLEFDSIIIDSLIYFNQIEFFIDSSQNRFHLDLSKRLQQKLSDTIISNFDNLRIIRGSFSGTLNFEKMSNQEQIIYKIKRLLRIDELDKDVINLLLDKYDQIIEALKVEDRRFIYEDDLTSIIDLFKYVSKYRELNVREIIKLYYDNCAYTYELFLIKKFKEVFPEEYSKFIKGKKKIINQRLKEMISYDVDYFYYNQKYQSLSELLCLLEEELVYLYEDDDILSEQIEYYSTIPETYYEWLDKIEEQEYDYDELDNNFEEIEDYGYHFMQMDNRYDFDDKLLLQQAKGKLSNKEIEELMIFIEDSDYLYSFTNEQQQVELIIMYYKKYKCFPEKKSYFCKSLINFVISEAKLEPINSFEKVVFIGFESFLTNEKVFTKKTFASSDSAINIEDPEIQTLINSKLFIKNSKWIRFANPLLHVYCTALAISALNDIDKENIYSEILFALTPMNELDFDFIDEIYDFYYCLMELDPKGFTNNVIYHTFKHFLNNIKTDNKKTIIISIIKYFHLTIGLYSLSYNKLDSNTRSIINSEIWDLLELMTGSWFNLSYYLSQDAFKKFKNIFHNEIKKDNNSYEKYVIETDKLVENEKFFNWLEEYELDNKILEIYTITKLITEFCKEDYLYSFEEYRDYIKRNIIIYNASTR